MGLGPAYPRRPRPLPDRSEWPLSAPIPDSGHLRALAAAAPGIATYPDATRSPARQPQWTAARAADRDAVSTVGATEPAPEIAPQPADTWKPARPGDTPGELVPEHGPAYPIRLDDLTPLEIPAGSPGADLEQSAALADPGPHDEEPAVPRWRWWRRTWTRWRTRGDRKPEEG